MPHECHLSVMKGFLFSCTNFTFLNQIEVKILFVAGLRQAQTDTDKRIETPACRRAGRAGLK